MWYPFYYFFYYPFIYCLIQFVNIKNFCFHGHVEYWSVILLYSDWQVFFCLVPLTSPKERSGLCHALGRWPANTWTCPSNRNVFVIHGWPSGLISPASGTGELGTDFDQVDSNSVTPLNEASVKTSTAAQPRRHVRGLGPCPREVPVWRSDRWSCASLPTAGSALYPFPVMNCECDYFPWVLWVFWQITGCEDGLGKLLSLQLSVVWGRPVCPEGGAIKPHTWLTGCTPGSNWAWPSGPTKHLSCLPPCFTFLLPFLLSSLLLFFSLSTYTFFYRYSTCPISDIHECRLLNMTFTRKQIWFREPTVNHLHVAVVGTGRKQHVFRYLW